MDLQHPVVESLALPLGVAFAVTALFRFARSPRGGTPLAGLGVGIGFLLAIYFIVDGLVWPPRTGLQKLPYIAAAAIVLGVLLERRGGMRLPFFGAAAAAFGAVLLWLAWPQLTAASAAGLGPLGLFFVAGLMVLWRVAAVEQEGNLLPAVMLVAAALGAAGAAFNAGSLALSQLALALAAATGGFVLWNWPRPRLRFGQSGTLAATVGLLSVAALMIMLSGLRPWVLLPLLAVFFTDRAARLLPVPGWADRRVLEPVYVALLSVPLVAAAILLAVPPSPADDLYYY